MQRVGIWWLFKTRVARQLVCQVHCLSGWLARSIPLRSFHFHLLTSFVNCKGQRLHCFYLHLRVLSGPRNNWVPRTARTVTVTDNTAEGTTRNSSLSQLAATHKQTPLLFQFYHCKFCLFCKALNAIMIQLIFLLPVFLLHMFWRPFNSLCHHWHALSFRHVFFLGAYAVCYCAHFTTSWPHCQVQLVALSCSLPAWCACALVRQARRQATVLCWSQAFSTFATLSCSKRASVESPLSSWTPSTVIASLCHELECLAFPYFCDFINVFRY